MKSSSPRTTRHAALTCPACGFARLDASTGLGNTAAPSPGDVTVCGECGEVLLFGEGLKLERASAELLAEIELDPKARRAIALAQVAIRKKGRRPT